MIAKQHTTPNMTAAPGGMSRVLFLPMHGTRHVSVFAVLPTAQNLMINRSVPKLGRRIDWENLLRQCCYVAIIVLACSVSISFLGRRFFSDREESPKRKRAGWRFSVPAGQLPLKLTESNLAFVISRQCQHCSEALPIYRELIKRARISSHARVNVLVFVADADSDAARNLPQDLDIARENILQSEHLAATLPGVPLLLLLERNSIVVGSWLGVPSKEEQKAAVEMALTLLPR